MHENDLFKEDNGNIGIVKYGEYKQDGVSHYGWYIEWGNKGLRPDILYWRNKGVVLHSLRCCRNCEYFETSKLPGVDYECSKTHLYFMQQKINPNDCCCSHWGEKERNYIVGTVC